MCTILALPLSLTWPGLLRTVLPSGAAEKVLEINNVHANGHSANDPARRGG